MAELINGLDLERSVRLYELLYKSGKLCIIPDCPQQKYCSNNSDLCFTHQKVADKLLSLETIGLGTRPEISEETDHAS